VEINKEGKTATAFNGMDEKHWAVLKRC